MPPWCIWPALFIGLSLFYVLVNSVGKTSSAFAYGWLFGFGYFAFGLSWIGNALLVEGSQYKIFWPLAVAALPALLALFPAAACLIVKKSGRTLNSLGGFLLFNSLLIGFEWLRGNIFTGFPWNLYGYSWSETLPMAQLASIGSIYWLTLLTCFWATAPGFVLIWNQNRRAKTAFIFFVLLTMGVSYGYGSQRLADNPTNIRNDIAIKLVQPNIAQKDKWNPEKTADNIRQLLELSEAERLNMHFTTLIVWPETALTDYMLNDVTVRNAIKTTLAGYEMPAYLLSGVMRFETDELERRTYYNSIVLFDKRLNIIATYDKSHLVPFGEYIPFQKWIPLSPVASFTGFQAGSGPQTIKIPSSTPDQQQASFSPLVCYEIIFPGAVRKKGANPGFIVNVTNDAWYGDSAGPHQHLVMAQFRAIEEGIPVIRSANTGISGVIDPVGRIPYREGLFHEAGNSVALPQKLGLNQVYLLPKIIVFWTNLIFMVSVSAISCWNRVHRE